MKRRQFLDKSLRWTAAAACSAWLPSYAWGDLQAKRILVLGGTSFLGPAVVNALVGEGHTVTLFNRGVTNPDLFPHLERLRGFRSSDSNDQNLDSLAHRRFDAIIDVWPNDPNIVASAAEALKTQAPHYLFVSSIAAYDSKEFAKADTHEDAPMEPFDGPGRLYNRNKAESERRLHRIVGERLTIVRPGPIKGRRDTTPDLLMWLLRAQEGGEHIAPGDGHDPVELVDVDDVARFLVMAIRESLYGTYNLAGKSMTFREFLDACKAATRSDANFVWIPQKFLHEHGLDTDAELKTFSGNFPFWRPDPKNQGVYRISSDKAFQAGWRTRPFEETALDCLNDFYSGQGMERSEFLPADKEKEVLQAWKHRAA